MGLASKEETTDLVNAGKSVNSGLAIGNNSLRLVSADFGFGGKAAQKTIKPCLVQNRNGSVDKLCKKKTLLFKTSSTSFSTLDPEKNETTKKLSKN